MPARFDLGVYQSPRLYLSFRVRACFAPELGYLLVLALLEQLLLLAAKLKLALNNLVKFLKNLVFALLILSDFYTTRVNGQGH